MGLEATQIAPLPAKPAKASRGPRTHFGRVVERIHEWDRLTAADRALVKFLAPKRQVPNRLQRVVLDTAKVTVHDVHGLPLKTYVWENMPGSPYVLLGHGFMMSAASMLGFVKPLLQAGFSVVTWDQPGHGDSGGDSTYVQQWSDAYPIIAKSFAPLAGVVGFSLGGTAALMALAETQFSVPLMVCLNSPRQVDTVMLGFLLKHGCPPELIPLMHDAAAFRGWRFPEPEKCFMAGTNGFPETQFLFIQDQNDTVASMAEANYWKSKAQNASIETSSGLKHHGILTQEQWIERIVSHLDSQCPLPRKFRSRI